VPPENIDLPYELTNGFAARFIWYKVTCLVSRASINRSDRDDLEQELKLHLVRRFGKFDPTIASWNSFVIAVVERYILTFLVMRRRRRQMRFSSLEALIRTDVDSNNDNRTMVVSKEWLGRDCDDPIMQCDLAIDVQHIIAHLPEQARHLCERLMSDSPAEVARQMQIPRTTLCSRILMLRNGFTTAFEETRKNVSSLRRKPQ
jgi:RNA polymerase sigma-70 factor, ECF subfamily